MPELHDQSPSARGPGPPVGSAPFELLLAAAEGTAEIEAATQQLEPSLFLQAKWLTRFRKPAGVFPFRSLPGQASLSFIAQGRRRTHLPIPLSEMSADIHDSCIVWTGYNWVNVCY